MRYAREDMLDFLAEQKIAEAVSRGELDGLPGEGRPLELDDVKLLPEDLRLAYRILKNAGFVPPEVEALNEIANLERLVTKDSKAARKLALLNTRIETRYYEKTLAKLNR
jgi:DnaJ homologue, subfamily C, member 28, conserved domain